MWIRSFFGGIFITLGCAVIVLVATAMLTSMQLETGTGLLYGLAGLGGGIVSVALGSLVVLFRR